MMAWQHWSDRIAKAFTGISPVTKTYASRPMTAEEIVAFDAAFGAMDIAFAEMDKAFKALSGESKNG